MERIMKVFSNLQGKHHMSQDEHFHVICSLRSQVSSEPLALEWCTTTLHEQSREQFSCQDKQEQQQDTPNAVHTHLQNGKFATQKPVIKRASNGMRDPVPSTTACTQKPSTLTHIVTFPMKHQGCKLSARCFCIVLPARNNPTFNFSLGVGSLTTQRNMKTKSHICKASTTCHKTNIIHMMCNLRNLQRSSGTRTRCTSQAGEVQLSRQAIDTTRHAKRTHVHNGQFLNTKNIH